MELAPFPADRWSDRVVAGVSKGHVPPPLWMRTAMSDSEDYSFAGRRRPSQVIRRESRITQRGDRDAGRPAQTRCRTCRSHGCAAALRARAGRRSAQPQPLSPTSRSSSTTGLRWINIERPGPLDRAWLEEHFEFHPLDYEDVLSRNQRPKIDEYEDYLFIVLHFPVFDKTGRAAERRRARHLRRAGLPDHAARTRRSSRSSTCSSAAARHEEAARAAASPRARLPALQDRRRLASTTASRCCARWATSSTGSRRTSSRARAEEVVRDISNAKQEIINFRKIIRPQRSGAARPRAHQAALPGRRTWRSTSTTSSTPPSASGTCSRTTRRSWRRSRTRTSR